MENVTLCTHLRDGSGQCKLYTVNADFIEHCLQFPVFAEYHSIAQFTENYNVFESYLVYLKATKDRCIISEINVERST